MSGAFSNGQFLSALEKGGERKKKKEKQKGEKEKERKDFVSLNILVFLEKLDEAIHNVHHAKASQLQRVEYL